MTTKRKIFETVKSHLLTQKSKCMDIFGGCRYRDSTRTLKCAIGALIPNESYKSEMDDAHYVYNLRDGSSLEVSSNPLVKEVLCGIYGELDLEFLTQLQKIHDCMEVKDWETVLSDFEERGLDEVSHS
jgi:hypothetical protein